jgi:hypothetical protein
MVAPKTRYRLIVYQKHKSTESEEAIILVLSLADNNRARS